MQHVEIITTEMKHASYRAFVSLRFLVCTIWEVWNVIKQQALEWLKNSLLTSIVYTDWSTRLSISCSQWQLIVAGMINRDRWLPCRSRWQAAALEATSLTTRVTHLQHQRHRASTRSSRIGCRCFRDVVVAKSNPCSRDRECVRLRVTCDEPHRAHVERIITLIDCLSARDHGRWRRLNIHVSNQIPFDWHQYDGSTHSTTTCSCVETSSSCVERSWFSTSWTRTFNTSETRLPCLVEQH